MKKIKSLINTFVVGTTIVLPLTLLTSCGDNKSKEEKEPITPPSELEKTRTVDAEKKEAQFYITLKSPLASGQIVKPEIVRKETKPEGLEIKSSKSILEKDPEDEKKLLFTLKFTNIPSLNLDDYQADIDIKFTCLDSNVKEVWTQQINNFKLLCKVTTVESHKILTPSSYVNNVEIQTDVNNIRDDEPVGLTFTNNRLGEKAKITDGILGITAGTSEVSVELTEEISTTLTKTFTRNTINDLLVSKGKSKMNNGDTIKFSFSRKQNYQIVDNRLQNTNEFGRAEYVSDTTLTSFTGRWFTKDENNDLVLSDKDTAFDVFVNTLAGDTNMYLIDGSYYCNSISHTGIARKLSLFGLNNSKGKNATLVAHSKDNTHLLYWNGISTLTLGNLNIEASQEPVVCGNYLINGIQCEHLNCENCDFVGTYTPYSNSSFTDCNFDSSHTYYYDDPTITTNPKNRECVFIYSSYSTVFTRCNFTNGGKAIKIYPEENCTTNTTNKFEDCEFILDQSYLQKLVDDHVIAKLPSVKYCFEMDTGYMINDAYSKLDIWSCKATGYDAEKTAKLWTDDSTHHKIFIDGKQVDPAP